MALAALDMLAAVVAALATHLAGLDTLAVDDHGRGVTMAIGYAPTAMIEIALNAPQHATIAPGHKILVDRAPGREILGQQAPMAAGLDQIEHGLDRSPQIGSPWPATPFGSRQQRRNQRPLLVAQIGIVGHYAPTQRASTVSISLS